MTIYCSYFGCPNEECGKNIVNLPKGGVRCISGNPSCKHYQDFLKEIAIRDRKEFDEETRRESHDLDR